MCGILFHRFRREPARREVYATALGRMASRGPDHEGFSAGDGFRAGHRRLAIIDLDPEANQPFWSADGRYVLTYNGELYNYREVAARLLAAGVRCRTASDTEVVLLALDTFGVEPALRQFRGMFAFVLHDTVAGTTLAVRDHFGQKPLYYATLDDGVIFASDPLAVIDISGRREPDRGAYEAYLATATSTGTRGLHTTRQSFFAGVEIVPAGHILRVARDGGVALERYFAPWELVDEDRHRELAARDGDALLDELDALLAQSVARHLVSDVPAGVLLSGGIDSSAVFWYAAARNGSLQTFTKTSPGIETLPLTVVPQLLQRRPATAHFILQRKATFVRELDSFVRRSHAPSRWNSGPSMESLCHAARRNGVLVLLGGDCIDEFFGGYIHYRDYFESRPEPDDLGPLIDLIASADGRHAPLCASYLEEQRAVRTAILERLAFLADPHERLRHATLLHDSATFLQTCSLPHSDAYSMAASVELRNPMLDLDLFAFVVNLPMHLRADRHENGEYGKVLFRRLAEREIGAFTNVAKEGTRNYAMAMADPAYWNLDAFSIASLCRLPTTPDKRDLIRMINLEFFHNAFFAGAAERAPAELMTAAGRREFVMDEAAT